jgi:hypothetical protein
MEKVRIGAAIILAIVATALMVNLEEYTGNLFRNTLNGWFGPPGETVAMAVSWVYALAVCAFMWVVAYTTIFIFQSGLSE